MNIVNEFLIQFLFGASLGFSAAIVPGPFSSIVISQTLKHGFWEGVKVALSVFVTDGFFIILTVLALLRFTENDRALGLLSLVGAFYLSKLAWDNFSTKLSDLRVDKDAKPQSLIKGAMVLFLSPGSYFFWLSLAGPVLIKTYKQHIFLPVIFLFGIYLTFVGVNVILAATVSRVGDIFKNKSYLALIKITGVLLLIFAVAFAKEGLKLLNILS